MYPGKTSLGKKPVGFRWGGKQHSGLSDRRNRGKENGAIPPYVKTDGRAAVFRKMPIAKKKRL